MNVLIDTNVFIDREEQASTSNEVCETLRVLSNSEADIKLHPDTVKELKKYGQKQKRQEAIAKAKAYGRLSSPPRPGDDFLAERDQSDENERIDNALIYAVKENAAAFLVTQDSGIMHKARILGLENRVLSLKKAREIFADPDKPVEVSPPSIKEEEMYNLDVDDPFFDSLKKDYENFESWFEEKQKEGRKCWVYRKNDRIGALLIYKFESSSESDLDVEEEVFKICTFKVSPICRGQKIGELLLWLAFEKALKGDRDYVYLTTFPDKEGLIDLIEDFGFFECGEKGSSGNRVEKVFQKRLIAPDSAESSEILEKYYPSVYDGQDVNKFMVPIKPEYHNRLFTDFSGRQAKLAEFKGFLTEGNTIKKAYLCRSATEKISRGDLLIFYRSHDISAVTSIGVVEESGRYSDADEILEKIGRRSVYNDAEIQEMVAEEGNDVLVILFTHNLNLDQPLKKQEMEDNDVISGTPISIMEVTHDKYLELKNIGGLDGRLTFN